MSGKGSGRRPGSGYAEGFERIFGRKAPTSAEVAANHLEQQVEALFYPAAPAQPQPAGAARQGGDGEQEIPCQG